MTGDVSPLYSKLGSVKELGLIKLSFILKHGIDRILQPSVNDSKLLESVSS